MQVKVDISAETLLMQTAARSFAHIQPEILRIVSNAAEYERGAHEYHSRTGNLQESTKAEPVSGQGDPAEVDLVMGEKYASYVFNRSLSHIDDARDRAALEIEYFLDSQASTLGSV